MQGTISIYTIIDDIKRNIIKGRAGLFDNCLFHTKLDVDRGKGGERRSQHVILK